MGDLSITSKHEPTVYFSIKNANVTSDCIAGNRCPGQGK